MIEISHGWFIGSLSVIIVIGGAALVVLGAQTIKEIMETLKN
jgi:hypothetical protein